MSTDGDRDPFVGFILGGAVGDSLGLPREGLTPARARRLFGATPLDQCLIWGCGLVSDDTEHLRMTAQAWLAAAGNPDRFASDLGRRLRHWLIQLPAGTGSATARAAARLWLGYESDASGVCSAGNGPAMRSGVLGLCLDDGLVLRQFVRISTRLTHTDPRAETGALLVAFAAREARRSGPAIDVAGFLKHCRAEATGPEWESLWDAIHQSLRVGDDGATFAERQGWNRGVSGYMPHTVAAALYCWLRWSGDFRRTVEETILMGGDSDTTAAIAGSLAGAACGANAIPTSWTNRLKEWPYSVTWMQSALAPCLREKFHSASSTARCADPLVWGLRTPVQILRNLGFLGIVLAHGLRRLLP